MKPNSSVCFLFDDAWNRASLTTILFPPTVDAGDDASALRFITSRKKIDDFARRHASEFRPFTLFGSGDFHHLTALFTRQFSEPFAIVCFDNHPDWDIRPPKWSCGAWVNRALENPLVRKVSVWGCDNTECHFPSRLLGNRRACRDGSLTIAPWEKADKPHPAWLQTLTPATWRGIFQSYLRTLGDLPVYVTIDLDCLRSEEAVTDWESGRFTGDDLVWALGTLREGRRILGGDLCGARSTPQYATRFQKFASRFDHPKLAPLTADAHRAINDAALSKLWPALIGDQEIDD